MSPVQSQAVEILMLVEDVAKGVERRTDILMGLTQLAQGQQGAREVTPDEGLAAEMRGEDTEWVHEGETPQQQEVESLLARLTAGKMTVQDTGSGGWV